MEQNEELGIEKKTNKYLEIKFLAITLISCAALFSYIFFTKDNAVKSMFAYLSSGSSLGEMNYNVNCSLPEKKNSPYCQEKRGQVQETWNSVSVSGGKGSKIRLYKK